MSVAAIGSRVQSSIPKTDGDRAAPGGGFLVAPVPRNVFCREQLDEETGLFVETAEKFWRERVLTNVEALERKEMVTVDGEEIPLAIQLLREAAEIGILALEIQEEYDGLDADKVTSFRITETYAGYSSQAVTFGGHAGIGTLPIVHFGSEEQKQRYLPRLAMAEIVSCYALTEPGSGSDALSGKTTARLSADGTHYVLNGEKIWISNGSWADISVVFARLEGKYSAFIVDLHQDGVTRGKEEEKMGLHGSSTTTLTFADAKVPLDDLLGRPGDAPKIALNVLYLGRLKLAATALGAARYSIDKTLQFGIERKQFGQPVITFGMQKAKLADMVTRTFALDSACYRVLGEIEEDLSALEKGPSYDRAQIGVFRRFGVETSMMKILGSETLMQVANHAVRMHGGYGFSREYHVERVMRDNVVDTIFEGTNDINRMVCFGDTVKSIYGGSIPFREYTEAIHRDLREDTVRVPADPSALASDETQVLGLKRALAYTLEQALIGVGKDVKVEQQVMSEMASAMIELYATESTLARTLFLLAEGTHSAHALRTLVALSVHQAACAIAPVCREILAHVSAGADRGRRLTALERLLTAAQPEEPVDAYALRTDLADHVIEAGSYPF